MHFTAYGKTLAQAEPAWTDPTGLGGASAHMAACSYDTGITVLLTGTAGGKRVRKTAKSVFGAYAVMRAVWGVQSAWHIRDDGTRRLIGRR